MKTIYLSLLLAGGVSAGAMAEQFRTDINPALRYYQAFILAPDLSPVDHDYLLTNEWRGQKLPERVGELLTKYDHPFAQVRQAALATVPCDWGIDMSPGPATLLPGLARNKSIVVTSRLRAMWALQNDRPADAVADLVGAFALARNTSRDGTLISVLVQIACENILCNTIAENYYQLAPETLKQIVDGFNSAPPRGTVAGCLPTEKTYFHDWLKNRITDLQKENPGNDAKVMASLQEVVVGMRGDEGGQNGETPSSFWDRVVKSSGGTSDGILALLRDEEPLYSKVAAIMALPQPEYETQMKEFQRQLQQSPDPFVPEMFSAWEKCRAREFGSLVRLEMVRAAAEYKLRGDEGLRSVLDPYTQAPFEIQRFVYEGVDRGFEIKSTFSARGTPEHLVFVEKDGKPFSVGGVIRNEKAAPAGSAVK